MQPVSFQCFPVPLQRGEQVSGLKFISPLVRIAPAGGYFIMWGRPVINCASSACLPVTNNKNKGGNMFIRHQLRGFLVGACAALLAAGCILIQPAYAADAQRHDVLYSCSQGKCSTASIKPGNCACGLPMKWGHVIKVEGNEAILCQCGEGCKCSGLDPKKTGTCVCPRLSASVIREPDFIFATAAAHALAILCPTKPANANAAWI